MDKTHDMNFLELVKQRCSVRAYLPREVEAEKIDYLLECGRLAPSACNRQPWRLIVVRDEARRKALQAAYNRDWFGQAPVCIVVCVDDSEAWVRSHDGRCHSDVDAAIVAEHLVLAAAEQGLGCCWVCAFDPAICAQALGIEAPLRPVALLPIGYPAPAAAGAPKNRKPIAEIVKEL